MKNNLFDIEDEFIPYDLALKIKKELVQSVTPIK